MKHSFKSWIALLLCLLFLMPTVLTACKKKGETPEDTSADTSDTSDTAETTDTSDTSDDTSDTSDTSDTEDTEDTEDSEEVVVATGLSFKDEEIFVNLTEGTLTMAPIFAPLNTTDKTLTWTSSDTTIAEVDEKGVLTLLAGGTTTITATLAANEEISASCDVTVIYSALEITLDASELTMTLGEEGYLISESLTPEESNDSVTWSSSDPTIVEADEDGYLRALKSGTVTITATTGSGMSATAKITVISCGITSNTLTTTRGHKMSGSVSNATATFNFDENIIANAGTTYYISLTKDNPTALESNTVNLAIGNNVFYVVATDGADTLTYEVTIRRRPIYTVTVDVNGGSALTSNTIRVEEGSKITPPNTTMEGFFCTWDADLTAPIMGNMTITATWHRSVYTFTYDDSCGSLAGTSIPVFWGDQYGATITQPKLDSDGNPIYQNVQMIDPSTGDPMVDGNGDPIYEQETDPETGDPMFDGDGNPIYKQEPVFETIPNPAAKRYQHGIPAAREGYTFLGFECIGDDCDNLFVEGKSWDVMRDITIKANWEALPFKVTLTTENEDKMFSGSFESTGSLIPDTDVSYENIYDTEVTVTAPRPNLGYSFVGWYSPIDPTAPNAERTVYSTDRAYTFKMGLDVALEAVYVLNNDMADFVFTSTTETCTITGFIDPTSFKYITEFTFPACVTNIAEGLFAGMSNLTSFVIPEGNTAFTFANGILVETSTKTLMWAESTAAIPADGSVTIIGKNAFENSRGMVTITIPAAIESISENAFLDCKQLVEIKNLSDLTITAGDATGNGGIGKYAKNVYSEDQGQSYITSDREDGFILYNDGTTVVLIGYNGTATELVLPAQFDGIDYTIGLGALSSCTNLTKITIPFVGANIGAYANSDGTQLFGYIFGVEKVDAALTAEYVPATLTEVIVTGGTQIGQQAFRDCKNIKKVTLPEGLTTIKNLAFKDCTALESINLPTTLTTLNNALQGCSALTELTIPAGVTQLARSAFEGCSSLTSITIPSTVTTIAQGAFKNCTSLSSVTIEGASTINQLAFEGCTITTLTINGTPTINKNAFKSCTLTSVVFTLTDGWCVGTSAANAKPDNGTKGWAVDPTILTDPAKAAAALTTTDKENGGYLELYWKYIQPTT